MKKRVITGILFLSIVGAIYAVPAKRTIHTVVQADGSRLEIRINGDERENYFSTTDGFPIVKGDDGLFYYLLPSGEAGRECSVRQAHNPGERTADEQLFLQDFPLELWTAQRQNYRREKAASELTRMGEMPVTKGSPNIPVLLIAFQNRAFTDENPNEAYQRRLCRPATREEIENREGSAFQYFHDQSNGMFTPNFVVIGPVTLDKEDVYYGENDLYGLDLRAGEMISEAIQKAEAGGLVEDWSIFDNNQDGTVDVTYALYAGEGANISTEANLVWPHQSTLSSKSIPSPEMDNVRFDAYGCNNELMFGKIDGFGTFCHEFSHCLGLPDFYPTVSGVEVFGMDYWSLMDFGSYKCDGYIPVGYTAYEKELLGWKELKVLAAPTTVTALKTTADGGEGYKIVNPKSVNEYYILETVDNSGWNKGNYAQGLLVTHVNYNAQTWKNNTVNNNIRMPGVSIIPADNDLTVLVRGSNEYEYESSLKGDLYPSPDGNNSLTDNSTPSAEVYVGLSGYMSQPITDIAYDAESRTTSFNFMGGDAQSVPSISDMTNLPANYYHPDGRKAKIPLQRGIYLQQIIGGSTRKVIVR